MIFTAIGVGLGGMTLVATIHAQFVVPGIMHRVGEEIRHALDRHESRPHPDAVGKAEWSRVLDRMDALASKEALTDVKKTLERIEGRITALERSPK